jgi:signal transduction histidine kinase
MITKSMFGQILKDFYLKLFHYVGEVRLNKEDLDPREIHIFFSIYFTSGFIMWGYTFIAMATMSSNIPMIVGLISSSMHALTPLFFRLTNKSCLPTNILLSTALIHEITYTHFLGGFYFNKLHWLAIFPLIAGVVSGKRGIFTWSSITLIVAVICLFFQKKGFHSEKQISELGIFLGQILMVIGQLLMTTTIIWVYAELRKQSEKLLQNQNKKVDDLFRVLFHDLANPLGRISIGLTLAKRDIPPNLTLRGFDIAKEASDSMMQITHNVRRMYALSKGKGEIDLSYVSLKDSLDYIQRVFSEELKNKKIQILFSEEEIKNLNFFVEPISFNNQVLGNIISNAIKFSPEKGTIFISATLLPVGKFKIEIKDQGIGIPRELMDHLFDIHKKTSRPGTKGEHGTGFGLHIVKSFVEVYGGNVEIESFEGNSVTPGSTTVRLFLKGRYE